MSCDAVGALFLRRFAWVPSLLAVHATGNRERLSDDKIGIAMASNTLLQSAEWIIRQVYWRCGPLRRLRARVTSTTPPQLNIVRQDELRDLLREIGGCDISVPVMIHTSLQSLRIANDSDDGKPRSLLASARCILDDILDLFGNGRTLVIPTRPHFPETSQSAKAGRCEGMVLTYDPNRTPSDVGVINELFRIDPRAERSRHPLNSVSSIGPLSEEILKDNLSGQKPLPHGITSSYYRFYQREGIVIGLGMKRVKYLTIGHVAEDLLAERWPLRHFYRDRRFQVVSGNESEDWIVRERRPEFARCICEASMIRDFFREGILQKRGLQDTWIVWGKAREIVDYILNRNVRGGTYPYVLPSLAGPFR